MRCDHRLIMNWIKPGARVLDLGCGNGQLLADLKKADVKFVYGIDYDLFNIQSCLKKNISAVQANIESDFLDNFDADFFDTVIIGLTLHSLDNPKKVLEKALQIGKQVIVSFINCSHYQIRLPFLLKGELMKNVGNVRSHILSIREFEEICEQLSVKINGCTFLDKNEKLSFLSQAFPSWFSKMSIYRLTKKKPSGQ